MRLWSRSRCSRRKPSDEGDDKLLEDAIRAVRQWRKASTTRLQRHFRIGYTRAARLMDMLEERGIIGPPNPARSRGK